LVTALPTFFVGFFGLPQNARLGFEGVHSLALHAAVPPFWSPVTTQSCPAAHAVMVCVRPSADVATLWMPKHSELPTTKAPLQSPAPTQAVPAGHFTTSYVPFGK
jgi:hypothetical protein